MNESRPQPSLQSPGGAPAPQPAPASSSRGARPPAHLSDELKDIFEKAAERAKNDLAHTGKIRPTAFFVYTDGTMKVVSLSYKDDLHREILIRRIREKASAENVSEVLVLTEAEQGRHTMTVLSAATAATRIDYTYSKEAKTVTSWKIIWLDRPVRNVFLNGIFDKDKSIKGFTG